MTTSLTASGSTWIAGAEPHQRHQPIARAWVGQLGAKPIPCRRQRHAVLENLLLLGEPDEGGLGIGLVVGQGLCRPTQRHMMQRRHPRADSAIARRNKLWRLVERLRDPCQRRAPVPADLLRQIGRGGDRQDRVGESWTQGRGDFRSLGSAPCLPGWTGVAASRCGCLGVSRTKAGAAGRCGKPPVREGCDIVVRSFGNRGAEGAIARTYGHHLHMERLPRSARRHNWSTRSGILSSCFSGAAPSTRKHRQIDPLRWSSKRRDRYGFEALSSGSCAARADKI